jgi:hypothetical protein
MVFNPLNERWDGLGSDNKRRANSTSRQIHEMSAKELHEAAVDLFAVSLTYGSGSQVRQETILEALSLGVFATFKQNAEVHFSSEQAERAGVDDTSTDPASRTHQLPPMGELISPRPVVGPAGYDPGPPLGQGYPK